MKYDALRNLLRLRAPDGRLGALAGPRHVEYRREIIRAATGKLPPARLAGVTALGNAIYAAVGIDYRSLSYAERDHALARWIAGEPAADVIEWTDAEIADGEHNGPFLSLYSRVDGFNVSANWYAAGRVCASVYEPARRTSLSFHFEAKRRRELVAGVRRAVAMMRAALEADV